MYPINDINQIEVRPINTVKLCQLKIKMLKCSQAKVKPHKYDQIRFKVRFKMKQFPVSLNDVTTRYKLQSMANNVIFVMSYSKVGRSYNREYIVLNSVYSLEGVTCLSH